MNIKIAMTIALAGLTLAGCEQLGQSNAEQFASNLRGHSAEFTFRPSNQPNGTEYYYPDSNNVLYLNKNGVCKKGSYTLNGDAIAYTYPNTTPNMGTAGSFIVKRHEGKLVPFTKDGTQYQSYEIVSDEPIDCTPVN